MLPISSIPVQSPVLMNGTLQFIEGFVVGGYTNARGISRTFIQRVYFDDILVDGSTLVAYRFNFLPHRQGDLVEECDDEGSHPPNCQRDQAFDQRRSIRRNRMRGIRGETGNDHPHSLVDPEGQEYSNTGEC